MLLALSSLRPLLLFHVTRFTVSYTAVFPPLSVPGREQMGPLQRSIRSATFWPATRIPAARQGPAAERFANSPVPSVATSSHGHMQDNVLRWSPRKASQHRFSSPDRRARSAWSLRCPQHKQCDMSHSSSNTLHSSLRHNQVPPFSPAAHRPAWESSHCFPPREDI